MGNAASSTVEKKEEQKGEWGLSAVQGRKQKKNPNQKNAGNNNQGFL